MKITQEMLEHFTVFSPDATALYRVHQDGALETLYLSDDLLPGLGFSYEEYFEIARDDAAEMVLPTDRAGLRGAVAEGLRAGKAFTYFCRVYHGVKGFICLRIDAHVCGEMGAEPVLLVQFSDIAASGGIYQEAADASERIAIVIDRQTHELLYANEKARKNSVFTDGNLLNQTCQSFLYGIDQPCKNCFLKQNTSNGKRYGAVQRRSNRGGWEQVTHRFVSWCGHDAFVIFLKDTTEEKKRQDELKFSRETLDIVVDNLPVGLGVCTIRGEKAFGNVINQKLTDLLGFRAEDFFEGGREMLSQVHPQDAEKVFEIMSHCGIPGSSQIDFRFLREGETQYRWYQLMMKTILRDGAAIVFVCLFDRSAEKYAGEQALKSRQMYRAAAQGSKLIVWEYDAATHRIEMMMDNAYTKETCLRLGIPQKIENGPQTLSALVAEKDRSAFLEMYRKIDVGQQEACCEFELQAAKEKVIWNVVCTAVRDENDGLMTVCGIGRDVTAQRFEQDRFRREFQQLLSVNPEAIGSFRHNITRNLTEDGQGVFSAQFGKAASGTVDRHVAALASLMIREEDRKNFLAVFGRQQLLKSFSEGKTQEIFEYPLRLPDGCCHWVRGTLNMLHNPTTGDIEAVTYAADVTEIRKREEIARRVCEDEFDYVGIIYTHTQEFEFYNKKPEIQKPALHERVPYEACLDYVCDCFAAPEERRHMREITALDTILAVLKEKGRYETSYIRTEGESASRRQLRYAWLDEPSGEILVVRTDVTAAYAQEQRQLAMVRDALRQAEKANAAKTDFLARMSHDLRTPLSGVIGLSRLAMEEKLPQAEIKRYLAEINRSGEYLLGIINDILDMSKIESKRLELHPEPLVFEEFCATLRNVIGLQCAQKYQMFEIVGPEGEFVDRILVDKTRFIQIFVNLLTNAVKYTQEYGRIRLKIEELAQSEDYAKVRFTIWDNGIGMSPEFAARAFDPFERERDDDQGGTGLGLAIVKNLVELMGGSIHIESRYGLGTAVILEMELQRLPGESAAPQNLDENALQGRRILICEDNDINAEIAVRLLRRHGAQTERAANGRIGVEKFKASTVGAYDAVLMDMRMPVMDGLTAAKTIRGLDWLDAKTIPIIALTANAFEEDRESCIRAGMNAHLSKPIKPAALYDTLAKEIEKSRKGEQKK